MPDLELLLWPAIQASGCPNSGFAAFKEARLIWEIEDCTVSGEVRADAVARYADNVLSRRKSGSSLLRASKEVDGCSRGCDDRCTARDWGRGRGDGEGAVKPLHGTIKVFAIEGHRSTVTATVF